MAGLVTAFFIYTFASINNLNLFGLITASCITLAFLADVLLAPALVTIVDDFKNRPIKS